MKSFKSSFENISAVVYSAKSEGRPDPKIFFLIAAYIADAATVNSNGTKTLLANG